MVVDRNARPAIIERAFEIAASGEFSYIADLTRRLNREGYEMASAHLAGPLIRAQIKSAMRIGKTSSSAKLEKKPMAEMRSRGEDRLGGV